MKRKATIDDLIRRHRARVDRKTMNMGMYQSYRSEWNWKSMLGSAACIKWSFRDLRNLDMALKLFSRRDVAVQAGGNLGLFAKRLAEEFTQVHSFEPSPKLHHFCKVNAPESNIIFHQVALGDHDGMVGLSGERRNGNRPTHEGLTHVSGGGNIPMKTIDSFAFDKCDLIYLDIEGYELKALRGANDTIARCRPVIGVEINHNIDRYGDSADELRQFLYMRGYRRALMMNSDEVFVPEEILR